MWVGVGPARRLLPAPLRPALEIQAEAKGGDGPNLDRGEVVVDLGYLGGDVSLYCRVGGGIDANHRRHSTCHALQLQGSLWGTHVGDAKFGGKAEAPAISRDEVAEANRDHRGRFIEGDPPRSGHRIGGAAAIAYSTQRERLARAHGSSGVYVIAVVK